MPDHGSEEIEKILTKIKTKVRISFAEIIFSDFT